MPRLNCLDGGFLRLEVTGESGVHLNMPTFEHRIPLHLRGIGSRFLQR